MYCQAPCTISDFKDPSFGRCVASRSHHHRHTAIASPPDALPPTIGMDACELSQRGLYELNELLHAATTMLAADDRATEASQMDYPPAAIGEIPPRLATCVVHWPPKTLEDPRGVLEGCVE